MIGDLKTIKALIKKLPKERLPIRLMEVCGTHTVAISRMGIRPLLRGEVELISGPGCPVCVTPANFVAKAIWLAENGCTVVTFGDMMKVPAGDDSLFKAKARGCDIRVVYSPMDALEFASLEPENHVVFLGIGFETTAPTIAGAVLEAEKRKLENFSVLCGLKTIPRPLEFIASSDELSIDGFVLPGHVSTIIGRKAYEFIAEKFGKPGTITGFEDGDIIEGIAE
ncbi:MAG TPA: hydrogenase formation protein HypD, partial [candidate division Zixibacteria bacterium]|nr:hydrogenase formation protein HypD [candidate division Zixibacteria bacterium]